MATSGTIGNTRINTAKLLEKAVRRCGLPPQVLTPEIVVTAQEDLLMLLMGMSNRGLNLWCIDRQLVPLVASKKTYVLPVGTTDVLNLLFCAPTRASYTLIVGATDATAVNSDSAFDVVRYGIKFSTLPTTSFLFETSADGLAWTTISTVTSLPKVGEYGWYDVDPKLTAQYFRVSSPTLGVVEDLLLASSVREITVSPFNRDDYASQPNKDTASNTSVNFWFEKLVNPQITLWPVPSVDTNHLNLFRYRQLQDVGSLTEEIELPLRWYEAVSWHLAARLAFEIPGVDPARRQEVLQMASSMTIEVEGGETDSSPTYFAPNIRCYTR